MIITIARQCGCGAVKVGQLLSEHYHIPFYTRKSLMLRAEERGLKDKLDDFFEERPVDELLFSIANYGEDHAALTVRPLRLLAQLVADEDCIIIGRCGNHIFRHRPDLVSVFLGGDKEERIKAISREEHTTFDDARDFVEQTDDCRTAYHKYYTGLTWGNATDYDICLDTCRLGTEQTARIIEQYVESVEGNQR